MKPSWVTDNYDIWLRGDDVDFEEVCSTFRSLHNPSDPILEYGRSLPTHLFRHRAMFIWHYRHGTAREN